MPGAILDPTEWQPVAAPAGGAILDPGEWQPVEDQPQQPKTGKLEAFLRGVRKGGLFGFGDELTGLVESAFTDKTYEQARDESRAADKQAEEEHPILSLAGSLAGGAATSFVPMGALGRLAGTAGHIARGAATGALSAAGESEAGDLTGVVQDAAKGGLVGGAVGGALGAGADRLLGGAQGRVDRRLLSDIGDGSKLTKPGTRREIATLVNRLGADDLEVGARKVAQVVQDEGLAGMARTPEKLAPAALAAKQAAGKEIGEFLDQTVGGVPLAKVLRAMHKAEEEYRRNPSLASQAAADKIAKQIEAARTQWQGRPLTNGMQMIIPATEVNSLKSSIQEGAFAGGDVAPKIAKRAEQDASRALRRVLEDEVKTAGGTEAGRAYRELNDRFAVLATVAKAAGERAQKSPFPAQGLRAIAKEVIAPGLLLASGHPLGAAALAAAPVANATVRAADVALAKLVSAARAGSVPAQLVQQAISAGAPRALVERIAAGVSGGPSMPAP